MIIESIKNQRPGFIAGVVFTLLLCGGIFILSRPAPPSRDMTASVKPGTGATADAGKPARVKDNIEIPITYDNPGASTVILPVDTIPEAYAWRRDVWSTTFMYSGDGTISALKGYRFGRVSFAAGLWLRAPRLDSPLHFRRNNDIDAGAVFAFTIWSNNFLF